MSIVTDASRPSAETESELTRYGIVRVPADHYEFGGYRYTNLADAVAEARRRQVGGSAR